VRITNQFRRKICVKTYKWHTGVEQNYGYIIDTANIYVLIWCWTPFFAFHTAAVVLGIDSYNFWTVFSDVMPFFLKNIFKLAGGEWSASRPCRFTPGEKPPVTHWIGGRVDPRTGLDDVEKERFLTLLGLDLRPLPRPARSYSLYRLRYPGSKYVRYLHLSKDELRAIVCLCQWCVKCSHESWVYKWSINRVTNPYPVYSHSYTWQYLQKCQGVFYKHTTLFFERTNNDFDDYQ
jgi:hypothetical protein